MPKVSGEFGFDLLMNDWVEPYGDGKIADFYVQREAAPTNSKVTVNSCIVFRGDGNGAYMRKKVKTTSDFKIDYEAPLSWKIRDKLSQISARANKIKGK